MGLGKGSISFCIFLWTSLKEKQSQNQTKRQLSYTHINSPLTRREKTKHTVSNAFLRDSKKKKNPMGNLDSKLSIAHFSQRRKCPDVWLGLTLTWRRTVTREVSQVALTVAPTLMSVLKAPCPHAHGHRLLGVQGTKTPDEESFTLNDAACTSTSHWGCFSGAKGSITILANLIWVFILSCARSSWMGTIQKPGKGPQGQGRPGLW